MNNNSKKLTMGLSILFVVSTVLTSCNECEDLNRNPNNTIYKISQTEKSLIDSYADDVAIFHGNAVSKGILEHQANPFDDESLYNFTKNSILQYEFTHLDISDTSLIPSMYELSEIYQCANTEGSLDFSKYNSVCSEFDVNFELINSKIESLQKILETSYLEAKDYDDFIKMYQNDVNTILSNNLSFVDYACLKMYSEVQLNSFLTWGEFYYGSAQTKGLFSWIRDKAEKLVDKIKPFFRADANGAVVGALSGLYYAIKTGSIATVGGAAASIGIGAAVGAVSSSLNEYINTPINTQGK